MADLTRLSAPPMIAMVPQWHLLDMLATAAREEPSFTLRMETEVAGLVREGGRATGVRLAGRLRTGGRPRRRLRRTRLAGARGLRPAPEALRRADRRRVVPAPAPRRRPRRRPGDVSGAAASWCCSSRGDYYQCALIIGKGTDARLRSGPVQGLRDLLADMNPWMAGPARLPGEPGTTSSSSRSPSTGCGAGRPPGSCRASATRPTRCRRSAASGSTSRCRTRCAARGARRAPARRQRR